jgi:hypothetical protein
MILLILGSLTPLCQQLIHQGSAGLQVVPGAALSALDAPLLGRDPQFIVSDQQEDFIPDIDAQGPAEGSGDDDTTILAHTNSGFLCHGTLHSS